MNYRIFIGLLAFVLAGCVYSNSYLGETSKNASNASLAKATLVKEENSLINKPIDNSKTKESFINFIYDLTQLGSINSSDRVLWQKANQFFPQTADYRSHNLLVQFISYTDSIFLLFYEFEQKASGQGAMFLASFNEVGKKLNHLELENISFDGTIAVNLINSNLIEIERQDFSVKEAIFYVSTSSDLSNEQESLVPNSQRIELSHSDYYQIDEAGHFNYLTKINIPETDRTYPEASSKILSLEELKQMDQHDLQMMRYEVYASYGYQFQEEVWMDYFSDKDWYEGRLDNIEKYLSGVERINVGNILALEGGF